MCRPGEVHALLGENGAGKSTLIKIIAGVHAPDAGDITINGEAVRFATPGQAVKAGIAIVYQELLLFPELSVAENIFLNHAPRTSWGGLDWAQMRERARVLLDDLDSHHLDVDAKVGTLSVANRQRVEIAKALSQNARVVDHGRADRVARRSRCPATDDHRAPPARSRRRHRLCQPQAAGDLRARRSRDGAARRQAHVGTKPISEVTETLARHHDGRPLDRSAFPKGGREDRRDRASNCAMSPTARAVRDISFTLRAGEILGIAGLVGSGRTELALTIFGITPATVGRDPDRRQARRDRQSPQQARDLGIAYVPEDRGLQGLIRPQTIAENISLTVLQKARTLVHRRPRQGRQARPRFHLTPRHPRTRARRRRRGNLSGGNQQKVVLAKWLAAEPRILIMDEPTRGIDVGAKSEIHALMSRLAQNGLAILMISSELPEVLGMSDRVLVMNGGRIVAEIAREDATPETVGAAMTLAAREAGGGMTSACLPHACAPLLLLAAFRSLWPGIVVLGAIIVLFVVVGLVNPRFLSNTNLTSIFSGNAYIAVAAIGMSMVIISGHIDVSVGSLIGVLATIAGTLAVSRLSDLDRLDRAGPRRHRHQYTVSAPVHRLYAHPVDRRDARHAVDPQRRPHQRHRRHLDHRHAAGILHRPGAAVRHSLAGLLHGRSSPSSWRSGCAIRRLAARSMRSAAIRKRRAPAGLSPERTCVLAFALHGFFAGIAALLFATQLQVIQSTVPPNLELTVITASVIGGVSILGGTGTVIGSTLAAILFACIGSALIFLNVSAYWLRAVLGLLILATVLADMARRANGNGAMSQPLRDRFSSATKTILGLSAHRWR